MAELPRPITRGLHAGQRAVLLGADDPLRARSFARVPPSLVNLVDVPLAVTDGKDLAVRQTLGQRLRPKVSRQPAVAFLLPDGPAFAGGGGPEGFVIPQEGRGA